MAVVVREATEAAISSLAIRVVAAAEEEALAIRADAATVEEDASAMAAEVDASAMAAEEDAAVERTRATSSASDAMAGDTFRTSAPTAPQVSPTEPGARRCRCD